MRQIKPEVIREKERRRTQIIIGVILIGLMVLSTAGYALLSSSGEEETIYDGQNYIIERDGYQYYLTTSQEEISKIPVNVNFTVNDYRDKEVFLDSSSSEITNSLYAVIGRYAYKVQEACYGNCTRDLPEKDCSSYVIIWKPGQKDSVQEQGKCVFIEGTKAASDAFLYSILKQ